MLQFEAKTERQIIEESLIPDKTECDFEVIDARDTISKKGNPMIELTLRVFRDDGRTMQIKDWLLTSIPMKLLRFCEATGLAEKYHTGTLEAHDCAGRAGKLIVGVQQDKDQQYPPQNHVKTYKALAEGEEPVPPVSKEPVFTADDIQF